MNLFTTFQSEILMSIHQLSDEGKLQQNLVLERITAEPPREKSHGDISTNAAMVLSKPLNMSPMAVAEILLTKFKHLTGVDQATAVTPGFINFRMTKDFWQEHLRAILKQGLSYGDSMLGQGQRINVEYPSINPTGPLHIGHCRIAIVGDVMASLLAKAGYQITRESYINDAGGQALHLARSLYTRYLEALGQEVNEPAMYRGSYLIPVAQAMVKRDGDKWVGVPEEEWIEIFRAFAIDHMMIMIEKDLLRLGIELDVCTSERKIVQDGHVDAAFEHLKELGLIYQGILEAPKGKVIEDWEPREQSLFKSTLFGDDVDRALKKSDGSWTYLAPDIAYHYDKYRRGSEILIDILGADHIGYTKRITAAVSAISEGKAKVVTRICQLVKFMDRGTVLKMSKRAGVFVTVEEAVAKVGKDAIRFMMMTRKNDAAIDFDFDQVVSQTRENPVFYVQYAYARCHSVRRHLMQAFPDLDIDASALSQLNFDCFQEDADQDLIKTLASWPRQIEAAAQSYEPHRIAYYLLEIAGAFHALWNKGKEESELRFIFPQDAAASQQRFALVWATVLVLASGFKVLGIDPLEELRA
ncbi:MAG: arginine--tRNA ligase [Janthinobacterium lividum]